MVAKMAVEAVFRKCRFGRLAGRVLRKFRLNNINNLCQKSLFCAKNPGGQNDLLRKKRAEKFFLTLPSDSLKVFFSWLLTGGNARGS